MATQAGASGHLGPGDAAVEGGTRRPGDGSLQGVAVGA